MLLHPLRVFATIVILQANTVCGSGTSDVKSAKMRDEVQRILASTMLSAEERRCLRELLQSTLGLALD